MTENVHIMNKYSLYRCIHINVSGEKTGFFFFSEYKIISIFFRWDFVTTDFPSVKAKQIL